VGLGATGIAFTTSWLAQLTSDQAAAAVIIIWVHFIMAGNAARIRSFHAELGHDAAGI
jgi:hypothetical protein